MNTDYSHVYGTNTDSMILVVFSVFPGVIPIVGVWDIDASGSWPAVERSGLEHRSCVKRNLYC